MANFDRAFTKIVCHEGGYVCDPDDVGGETYRGISRRYHPKWEGWVFIDTHKGSRNFKKDLDKDQDIQNAVYDFYKTEYWDAFGGDDFESYPVAFELFDTGVNQGLKTSVKYLQRALNVLNRTGKLYGDIKVDGDCGPTTRATVKLCLETRGEELLFKVMNILQGYKYIEIMEKNDTQEKFVGWFERVNFMERFL